MLESCYANSEILLHSLTMGYQFRVFWLLLMIEKRPVVLQDANGTKIKAWIDLKASFQSWVFCEKFQYAMLVLGAACSLLGLGLCSGSYSEASRSTKTNKISWIHCFQYLISLISFPIFSMCILVQIWSILIKTCLIKKCTKYWPWNVHKKIFLG